MISTIIPTRNRPQWLEKALGSVAQQAISDMKVIVVDDASSQPDENRAMLAKFDSRLDLEYLYLAQPRGAAGARNVGIRAARGEFVAFLDDDDLWHPTKLLRQRERFTNNPMRVANLGVVSAWHEWVDAASGKVLIRRRPDLKTLDDLFQWNYNMIQTIMVRRQCLIDVGGFDEGVPKENLDLHARLIQRFGYDTVPEILVTCFGHTGPRASDGARERLDGLRIVLTRYGRLVDDPRILHDSRYRLGRLLLQVGDVDEARRELAEAFRLGPLTKKPVYLFWGGAALLRRKTPPPTTSDSRHVS